MRKRPLVRMFFCLMAGIWLLRWLGMAWIWRSPAGSLPERTAKDRAFVYAEGTVYLQEEKIFDKKYYTYLYLRQTNLEIQSKKYPIRNLKCICSHIPETVTGCRIRLRGKLTIPKTADNPGGFDQRQYEQARKIDFYLEEAQMDQWLEPAGRWERWIEGVRREGRRILEEIYPKKEAGILEGMLLGEKKLVEGETKTAYQSAGISHILAISGLHISLMGMAVWGVLQRIGFSAWISAGSVIGLLAVYGMVIGTPATAFRALVMFGLRLGGRLFGRSYDLLSALGAAGILLLWENPDLLSDCGFQLSFLAVTGTSLMEKQTEKRKGQMVKSGICLWFITLPVVLFHFYQVSVVGIVVNLAVIPFLPIVLGSGFLSLVLGRWSVGLGSVAGVGAYGILKWYGWLGETAVRLPFGMWTPGQPGKVEIFLYYLVLVIYRYRQQKRVKKRGIAVAVFLLFLMAAPWRRQVQITMLDVGQGDGIVLQDGKESLLIDGGSSNERQVGNYVILPYLKQQGISRLQGILVTHSDQDHITGVKEVIEEGKKGWFAVENLLMPWWMEETKEGKELVKAAGEQQISCYFLKAGDSIRWGRGRLQILHPGKRPGIRWEPNAGSMVCIWEWKGHKALFTGDLPMEAEKEIVRMGEVLQCEVLKVAHHGANGSTSENFLRLVSPQIALISCGEHNRYGHPGKELLRRLQNADCQIFRTDRQGAVICRWK